MIATYMDSDLKTTFSHYGQYFRDTQSSDVKLISLIYSGFIIIIIIIIVIIIIVIIIINIINIYVFILLLFIFKFCFCFCFLLIYLWREGVMTPGHSVFGLIACAGRWFALLLIDWLAWSDAESM